MRSLINKNNVGNYPLILLIFLITIYICPNIRLLSAGEMSCLPAFIILITYSFLNIEEFLFYLAIAILTFCALFISSMDIEANQAVIKSGLISYYILSVPLILSIIFGRLFAFRFKLIGKKRTINEIKFIIYFLVLIFFASGFLNTFAPSLLPVFLFTGRTSFSRLTFFFSEPSQAASVILFLWFFAFQFLFNKKFISFFGSGYFIFSLITLILALATTLLSLPGTLIMQIVISFGLTISIYLCRSLLNLLRTQRIRILTFRFSRTTLLAFLLVNVFSLIAIRFIFFGSYSRITFIFDQIASTSIIDGLTAAGGFRFYYAFASVYYSIVKIFSLPGDWLGTFINDLLSSLDNFAFAPGDDVFQLVKDPINIKPLGWLYFCMYDLGIIGFSLYIYFAIRKYFKIILNGILKNQFLFISAVSFQMAILIVPVLPSTPCIFIPLLLVIANQTYSKLNIKEI